MFFKREWPTRVENVVEEGRREKYHSASCLLKMQTAFRENKTSCVETQTSFNLDVILTNDEVCLSTEADCEIHSMQRVDTDGNAHQWRTKDYDSVLA